MKIFFANAACVDNRESQSYVKSNAEHFQLFKSVLTIMSVKIFIETRKSFKKVNSFKFVLVTEPLQKKIILNASFLTYNFKKLTFRNIHMIGKRNQRPE